VDITRAKVELVNVYNNGDVKLGDRTVVTTGSTGSYTLDKVGGDATQCLSAIVPQELTYTTAQASGNLKFKISIINDNGTPLDDTDDYAEDVYYADVQPIKKEGSSDPVAPTGKWESGKHYVYKLHLTKTAVSVTATLTNWTTVNASEDVWF